jgi:hypothetical protein
MIIGAVLDIRLSAVIFIIVASTLFFLLIPLGPLVLVGFETFKAIIP